MCPNDDSSTSGSDSREHLQGISASPGLELPAGPKADESKHSIQERPLQIPRVCVCVRALGFMWLTERETERENVSVKYPPAPL